MVDFKDIQITALKVGGYGVVLFMVCIYFSTALAILLSAVLAVLWLVSGQFMRLCDTLRNYPVALWSLLLFACFIIGFSYGDATGRDAFTMLKKYRELLFIPLLLPFVTEQRYRNWAWLAFMIASIATVLGSQLMSIGLFCVNYWCTPYFKSYITQGILIAFFTFFLAHKIFDSRGLMQTLYITILLLCFYNLFFISEGRTGQLIVMVLMPLFALQRFSKKGVLLSVLMMTLLVGGFIGFSSKAVRIKEGIATAKVHLLHDHAEQSEYSMGLRFTFWKYSARLIAEKPVFGHGTGSFSSAYQRISGKTSQNPHNEFLLIGVQLGAMGLLFYAGFLFSQYYYAKLLPERDKWLAQGVFATLITTSLFNSPLLDHTEGHWFTMMIALCFAAREVGANHDLPRQN
jgi:O-antigen ligase